MIESPLRLQLVVAALAVGGALALSDPRSATEVAFAWGDERIDESSGLVERGDRVWTVDDSGSDPEVFVVDAASGDTVGVTTYTGDAGEVVDVEAIAAGPGGGLWVADIGDNGAARMSVAVYRLPTPADGDRTVASVRYDLAYPDGPRDAETLLVHPRSGRLFVVSKGLLGGRVYAAPPRLRADTVNVLRAVGRAPGLVTDGAMLPDGRHALLRTYTSMSLVDTRTWRSVARQGLPDQQQGEGLAVRPGADRVLLSSEGAGTDVLDVALSRELRGALASAPRAAEPDEDRRVARDDLTATLRQPEHRTAGQVLAVAALAGLGWLGVRRVRRRRQRQRQSRSTT